MLCPNEVAHCVCVCCPLGCELEVSFDEAGEIVEVTGWSCARGKKYAREEMTCPMRMVTAAVFVPGALRPLSVKTAEPVPKALISQVLAAMKDAEPVLPVATGDVVVPDVCGTGVDVVATAALDFDVKREGGRPVRSGHVPFACEGAAR